MPLEKQIIDHPPFGAVSKTVRAGDFLFVSGQGGFLPGTRVLPGEDFESEARQAFENLKSCLEHAGSTMDDVVKVVTWLADASQFVALNEIFDEYFAVDPPARSSPIIELPMGLRLSVEATAIYRG